MSTSGHRLDRGARRGGDTNLPAQPTPLIGRTREVLAARQLLLREDIRLLTLTGAPGVGKTRLAIAVAASLQNAFPDGVHFVDLSPLGDPALVIATLAWTLRLADAETSSPLERLVHAFRDQTVLVLLDNFEQLVPAAPLLAELLAACAGVKLLVTSRAPLHLRWEHQVPVPPLALPDLRSLPPLDVLGQVPAVALFVERAQAVQPAFQLTEANARVVAEICVHLDGLPLAIELAAAQCKVMPAPVMLSRLARRLVLLTGGAQDQPARQRMLRAAIDWSHELLAPAARALFRRLAVFAGGATVEAIEAVIGPTVPGQDLHADLAALVDQSLLRQDEGPEDEPRFRFLETVREYALEQLAACGELEELRRDHARCFLEMAERMVPHHRGARAQEVVFQLERERENLRAALGWAIDVRQAEVALRLCSALWGFWASIETYDEGRSWLARALALPGLDDFPVEHAVCLLGAGWLAFNQGDSTAGQAFAGQAVDMADHLRGNWAFVSALDLLGRLANARGDAAVGRALLAEALGRSRAEGHRWLEGTTLGSLAEAAYLAGDVADARTWAEEALQVSREVGYAPFAAQALQMLGQVSYLEGDLAQARSRFTACLDQWRAMPRRGGEAILAVTLGHVAVDEGNNGAARTSFEEGLGWWRKLGYRSRLPEPIEGFAHLAAAQGQAARALRLAGAAEALREAGGGSHSPTSRRLLDRWLEPARHRLGDEAAAANWAAGRLLTLDQVLAEALADPEPAPAERAEPERPPRDATLAMLTPRERQVAALVARGYTNRQIAATLVIAESTAHLHVVRLLNKLGFHNRAQAAAWAVSHDLAAVRDVD